MAAVVDRGRHQELRHFFFGSTQPNLARLLSALEVRYPGVEVAGAVAPGFGSAAAIAPPLDVGSAHILWCGLGAPKQELWMQHWVRALEPALVVGVGAAFDFLSGTKQRAPLWMQRHGLEWLHRLGTEPRRLGGRYAATNCRFVATTAAELAKRLWAPKPPLRD